MAEVNQARLIEVSNKDREEIRKRSISMSVINTNVSATLAANAILRNDRAMGTAMERLSTGLRIN